MKVQLGTKEYKITFRRGKWAGSFYNGLVICDIKTVNRFLSKIWGYPYWAKYAGGYALCVSTDDFNPAAGRRIALTRALRTFSRKDRTIIWKAYREVYGDKE